MESAPNFQLLYSVTLSEESQCVFVAQRLVRRRSVSNSDFYSQKSRRFRAEKAVKPTFSAETENRI